MPRRQPTRVKVKRILAEATAEAWDEEDAEGEEIRVVDVVCGTDFTLCVAEDGTVYSWGCNEYGCLGRGGSDGDGGGDSDGEGSLFVPMIVGPERSFFGGGSVWKLACGPAHVLALTEADTVYAWGNGEYGCLGLGDDEDRDTPEKVTFLTAEGNELHAPIHNISAGLDGSCFITESGKVYVRLVAAALIFGCVYEF